MLPFTKNAPQLEIGARSQEHITAINVNAKRFTCIKGVEYNAVRLCITVDGLNGTRFVNVYLPFERSKYHIRRVYDYMYQNFRMTKCDIVALLKSNNLRIGCLKRDVVKFGSIAYEYDKNRF